MPRIAYISSTFPDYQKCGTGIYAGHLTQALAQQGHDVHVITSALPEIRATLGNVTVHKVMQTWNPTDLPRLLQVLHQIRPDVVHINHPTSIAAAKSKVLVNLLPEINKATWKYPLVTTLHEFGQVSLLGKLKILPMALASTAVTVTSETYLQRLRKFLPQRQHRKIHVINIGCNFKNDMPQSDRKTQRERWELSPSDQVIGFVGFITPPKGFHNLIDAAAPLLRKDSDLKILALSSWNLTTAEYRQKIMKQIEKEEIGSQVIFTGFLDDDELWDAMSAVDVCVFPFEYPVEERSSGPLRQALVKGLPTLTYAKNTDYSEFGFRHGENIWFTPHHDQKRLRREIEILLKDASLRSHLSEGALKLKSEFSFDTISNAFSRLYSQLLS